MAGLWWYSREGQQLGPVPRQEVQRLVDEGVITPDTLLWTDGMSVWEPLSALYVPKPPPLPPAKPSEPKGSAASAPSAERRDHAKALNEPAPSTTNQDASNAGVAWNNISASKTPEVPVVDEVSIAIGTPASAGRRFVARLFDVWIEAIIVAFAGAVVLPQISDEFVFWINRPGSSALYGFLLFPFVFVFDALVYYTFGNTLGKMMLRIRVTANDGRRLTAWEYLKRNIGVWAYGFGVGFPLISVFTLIFQYRHVSAGRPTGYDIGKYRVDGESLSAIRITEAATAFVVLLAIVLGLNVWDKETERQLSQSIAWTNPVTSAQVRVPAGWTYEQQTNNLGQPIYAFTSPMHSLVVFFAMENRPAHLNRENYIQAFNRTVADGMTVHAGVKPKPLDHLGMGVAWVTTGHLAQDHSRKLHISFVERGSQVWRVVVISNQGRDPDTPAARELREILFSTL